MPIGQELMNIPMAVPISWPENQSTSILVITMLTTTPPIPASTRPARRTLQLSPNVIIRPPASIATRLHPTTFRSPKRAARLPPGMATITPGPRYRPDQQAQIGECCGVAVDNEGRKRGSGIGTERPCWFARRTGQTGLASGSPSRGLLYRQHLKFRHFWQWEFRRLANAGVFRVSARLSRKRSITMTSRAGFVALIGEPNAGKSTLLNRMVGAKVSIVTHKVQTTRARIRGVAIEGDSQIVFVDTPGLFRPRRRLDRAMVAAAWGGAADADITVLLVEAHRGLTAGVEAILERLEEIGREPQDRPRHQQDRSRRPSCAPGV